jgi:nitronate monooxygenase
MKLRCRDGSRPITMSSGSATCPGAHAIAPIFGEEMRQTVAALTPSAVSLHFGLPERSAIEILKETGVVILASATTVREAVALEAGGVDAVIAQGMEAGGHRGTFLDGID